MSRGAQRTVRQETEQQLGQQNQLISQANQSGQQDRSLLLPTITGLLNSQGYTPAQQSAITQQSLGAANAAANPLDRFKPAISSPQDIVQKVALPGPVEVKLFPRMRSPCL